MRYLEFILFGYVMGSILFAYFLPKWVKGIDITEDAPDGNPGVFNCIAKVGKPLGLSALACDLLKGALPVFLATRVLDVNCWAFAPVAAAPVVGHAWSMCRRFRGGKAIAVSFGVCIGLLPVAWEPLALLISSYLFFTLLVKIQPHRHRSIVTYLCFGVGTMVWLRGSPAALGCLLMAGVVILRHWEPEPEEEKVSIRFGLNRRN